MGQTKAWMMEVEDRRAQALGFLIAIGTLDPCEFHGLAYEGDGDIERAYRVANARITAGESQIGNHSRREFTDAIKHEYEHHYVADGCSWCAKLAAE